MAFKVFVSYSTRDLKNVQQLEQAIKNSEVEVHVADHSIRPGESLPGKITTAIAHCDLFIVLWSKNAKASAWVSQEIGLAHARNKTILPLVLSKDLTLPGFISDLKFIPAYRNRASSYQKARDLILDLFKERQQAISKKQQVMKQQQQQTNEALALLAIGALLIWAFSQK